MWEHRDDPAVKKYYDLSFAKRPAEKLYDLKNDPGQVVNVAQDPNYRRTRNGLLVRLTDYLVATADQRADGRGEVFNTQPYLGGTPSFPGR